MATKKTGGTKGKGKDGEDKLDADLLKFDKDKSDRKAGPQRVVKPFKYVLPVECSEDELMKAGRELAKCHGDLDRIDAGLGEARKKAAADREPLNTRVTQLVKTLDTGKKDVEIKCHRVLDYGDGTTRFVRTDTGDCFHERKMSRDEEQRMFQFFNPHFDVDRQ